MSLCCLPAWQSTVDLGFDSPSAHFVLMLDGLLVLHYSSYSALSVLLVCLPIFFVLLSNTDLWVCVHTLSLCTAPSTNMLLHSTGKFLRLPIRQISTSFLTSTGDFISHLSHHLIKSLDLFRLISHCPSSLIKHISPEHVFLTRLIS